MPKPRKKSSANSVYFEVSPWQQIISKSSARDDLSTEPSDDACVVVEEDIVCLEFSENCRPRVADTQSGKSHFPLDGPNCKTGPQPPPWQTAQQHKLNANALSLYIIDENLGIPEVQGLSSATSSSSVEGIAIIAVIGNRLVGSLYVESPDGKQGAYGISGKIVTAYRDCYRDLDWSVVRLEIWGLPGTASPVVTLVERTGGDAMRLRAPVLWNSGEELNSEIRELMVGYEQGSCLWFDCNNILSGEAAREVTKMLPPALIDLTELVNEGHMKLEWGEGSEHGPQMD